jgi:cobalt-zinc-cadmium efflux system protein
MGTDHGQDRGQGHGHGHDHGHSHAHGQAHPLAAGNHRAFLIAIALNAAFVAVELVYGWLANSTALVADAGHNLSDVLGLMLAWGASYLGNRQATQRYTYGLRGASILAALANAMLLLLACGAIAWEAATRFYAPAPVLAVPMIVVALVGVLVNGVSAFMFLRNQRGDINLRGAYLHLLADAAISLGVAASGVVILYTQWQWVDPLVSLAIVVVIVWGTWSLLAESVQLAMNAVPRNVNFDAVRIFLGKLPGVTQVVDLHIWAISTTENALTAELTMPAGHPGDQFLRDAQAALAQRFSVHHCTLQIATQPNAEPCVLAAPAVRQPSL